MESHLLVLHLQQMLVTLPSSAGTLALTSDLTSYVTASSTTTFTNKTIDADATGNNANIEDANIKSGTAIAQSKLSLAMLHHKLRFVGDRE